MGIQVGNENFIMPKPKIQTDDQARKIEVGTPAVVKYPLAIPTTCEVEMGKLESHSMKGL